MYIGNVELTGSADCPPSWYSKFVISGGFNLLHWMSDLGLFISLGHINSP